MIIITSAQGKIHGKPIVETRSILSEMMRCNAALLIFIAVGARGQATGPTVLLLTPRRGEPYKQYVQISAHVDIGEVCGLYIGASG